MNVSTPDQLASLLNDGRRARTEGNRSAALACFEAAAAIDPGNRATQLEIARELRALGRLEEGTLTLRHLLDTEPGDLSALVELAYVRRQLGDREGSLAAFEKARAVDPDHRGVMLEAARDLRALDRLDEAAEVIGRVLDAAPRDVGALIEHGHLSRRRGKRDAALAAFKEAAACDPSHLEVRIEIARELCGLTRLDEAAEVLAIVLNSEPENPGALLQQGHLLRQRNDHEGAQAAFRRAAAADPSLSGAKLELARELRALDRLDEADQVLAVLIDVEPENAWPHVERGLIKRLRGDRVAAAAAFEMASRADPHHAGIRLELVAEYRALGRRREAETILCELLKAAPNNSSAAVGLGQLMLDTNRPDEAEAVLIAARAAAPQDPRIAVGLGHVARKRGDPAAALRHLQSAAEVAPGNLDVKLALAAEMREQGLFDDAFMLVQSVLAANQEHWAAWIQLGLLYRARNDRSRAMQAFETAVAKRPSEAQGLVELANEKWALGRPEAADEFLQRALAQDPRHLGALIVSGEHALMREDPEGALGFATRAIELYPRQIGPYLLGARSAAAAYDRKRAEILLQEAETLLGPLPEIIAVRVHILRQYREHDLARRIMEQCGEQNGENFAFWTERTSLAITLGDFGKAEQALAVAPARSRSELGRVHFLRGKLAEGRHEYRSAIDRYKEALALDPSNSGWHEEIARLSLLLMDLNTARNHLRISFELNCGTRTARGQSRNISQSHTGQLLNEFELDPRLRSRLDQISRLPSSEQISPLRQLVSRCADYTSVAILLVLALRRAGFFERPLAPDPVGGRPKIPKRIVQFWHSETPPTDVAELMASWREKNPEYEYSLFSDASASRFLGLRQPLDTLRAFRRAKEPAQRADLFRLAYLASEGGYYVDADDRCLAPLHSYIPFWTELVGYQESYATVGKNLIGSVPNHPVIELARKLAVEALNRGDHDIIWLSTGPAQLTRAFAQLLTGHDTPDWFQSTVLLELHEAQRCIGIHCPASYRRSHGGRHPATSTRTS